MMMMVMMDDTAVGDGWSIDDYDAVLFICVGLLLCVRWGHCSRVVGASNIFLPTRLV